MLPTDRVDLVENVVTSGNEKEGAKEILVMDIEVGEHCRAPAQVLVAAAFGPGQGDILPVVAYANHLLQAHYFGDELNNLRVAILE